MPKPKRYNKREFRKRWKRGDSLASMAEHFGAGTSWVSATAERLGLDRRQISSGDLPGAEIEQRYLDGETSPQLAKDYGTDHAVICRVLRSRGVVIRKAVKGPLPGKQRTVDLGPWCVSLVAQGLDYRMTGLLVGLSETQVGHRVRKLCGPGKRGGSRKKRVSSLKVCTICVDVVRGMSNTQTVFTPEHLSALRGAFADLERIDPTQGAGAKLLALLDTLTKDQMQQFADAGIKFVSLLAKGRLLRWEK